MANRTVHVLRAFTGIGKDGSGSRYFTRDDGGVVEEFLSPEEFEYRKTQGFISVEEPQAVEPLKFQAPTDAAALEMGKVGGDFSRIQQVADATPKTAAPVKGIKPAHLTAEKQ